MRKLLFVGAVMAAAAPAAMAQEALTITGNVALATDYAYRGISQTSQNPAIQGGFDAAFGSSGFYVGTWASNVAFGGSLELDAYAGWKTTVGPVGLDVGVLGYFYPGASDDAAELDYYEGYIKASITPATGFTLGGGASYSPEFTAETGAGLYLELNGAYTVSPEFSISGAVGQQSIDDVNGPTIASEVDDDYTTWNIGGTFTTMGVGLDLRYVGTSIGSGDPIITNGFTNLIDSDDRFIVSVKKSL
jgi:uncharacterized protein (TIGR02001 family)